MVCPVCSAHNPNGEKICRSCGSPLPTTAVSPHALSAGTKLLGGAYTVGRVLGQGGFGITYLGSETRQRRSVAIKELFPSGSARHGNAVVPSGGWDRAEFNEAKEKFLQEAHTLKRFNLPSIVRVYAIFEENDTAYMVMEYLKGHNLLSVVDNRGAIPEDEAVRYIRETGEALAAVHKAGLLHRDLKPDNIIATDDGRVVLIDFGSAKAFVAGKTQHHSLVLTPGYAPLEQYAQRAQRGAYTDVYALGATLYHLLTGQAPVPATDRAAGVELTSPHQLNPKISRAVSDAVMRSMDMKVGDRPQTVRDFLSLLRRERPSQSPVGPLPHRDTPPLQPREEPSPRHRRFPSPFDRSRRQQPAPPPQPQPGSAPRATGTPPPRPYPPPPPPQRQEPPAPPMERIGVLPWLAELSASMGLWLGGAAGAAAGAVLGSGIGCIPGALLGVLAGGLLGGLLPYGLLLYACLYPSMQPGRAHEAIGGLLLFLILLFLGVLPLVKRRRRLSR